MATPLKILLVGDPDADPQPILQELRQADYEPEWQTAPGDAAYAHLPDSDLDLVLVDSDRPPSDGLKTLRLLKARTREIPVVILAGSASADAAIAFVEEGAAYVVHKERLDQLGRAVAHALKSRQQTDSQRRVDDELQISDERHRRLLDATPVAIVIHSQGRVDYVNKAFMELTAAERPEQLVGRPLMDFVHPDYREAVAVNIRLLQEGRGEMPRSAEKLVRLDGQVIDIEVAAIPVTYQNRPAIQVVLHDVSGLKRAESALEQSEHRYRHMVEMASDAVFTTDFRGYFTYMNPQGVRMTGYPEDDLIGMHFTELIVPEWRERVLRFYQAQFRDRVPETAFELPICTRDGREKWVEQKTTLLVEGDWVTGFQSIVRDITQRRRAQEAEREQRRFAEALAETAAVLNRMLDLDEVLDHILVSLVEIVPHDVADIMLVEDDDIRIVRSRGYEKYGVSKESVLALRLPINDTPNLLQMAQTQEPLVIADVAAHPEWVETQTDRWIRSYVGAPICVAGVVIGFLNLDSDRPRYFTQAHADRLKAFADHAAVAIQNARLFELIRQHAEELEVRVADRTAELRAANENLQALGRVKDEFVSNVSHELRTPITSIKLYHGLLEHYPDRIARYLGTLQRETARLERIVEDLLYLSRLDQAAVEFDLKPLDLNVLANEFVIDRSQLAKTRGLALTLNAEPDLPLVLADRAQLGKVLSILMTNALTYTPGGGRVTASTGRRRQEDEEWVLLSIQDTGPGIPPDERSNLFKRFFRGVAARDSGAPGTGLGLAIAREIVERHRGRIEVTSDDPAEGGTTFTLWLLAGPSGR